MYYLGSGPKPPLPVYRHYCGQDLRVGEHYNGVQLRPLFYDADAEPEALNVLRCPGCGIRLNLNDCLCVPLKERGVPCTDC